MKRLVIAQLAAAAVAAGGLLVAAPAHAADSCSTLTNPVYISGSSAASKLLKAIAAQLTAAGTPVTIVYQKADSCVGAGAIVNASKVTNTAVYWDAANTETPCDLPASGIVPDVGVSDVYADTCGFALGATQKDFLGPVQTMTFSVPTASQQSSISADAAYVALGFGGATYQVAPWTDPTWIFIRPNSSGTKNMIAQAIGLPVAKWKGVEKAGSGDVGSALTGSTEADKTLGILATDFADDNRTKGIKVLAYKHKNQSCGYLPDSTSSSFDKRNVREGRYAIWGSMHFLTNVTGSDPVSANAKTVLDIVTGGGTTVQKQAFIDTVASVFDVPQCAMKVTRASEMATPTAFTPDEACGCYYESKANKTATPAGCTVCADDSGCSGATPKCHYGFCEAH